MIGASPQEEYVTSLESTMTGLQRENDHLKQENDHLKQENMHLKRRVVWYQDARRLKGANSTDKTVLAEVMDDLKQHDVPKGEMYTPWLEGIAQRVQMSPSTVGRSIQFFADNGVLLRHEHPDPKSGKTRVDIGWTEQCERPRTITLTEPRKKKSGKTCLHCGQDALITKERVTRSQKITTCTNCGDVTIYQEREVNAPLEANCSLDGMDDDPTCNNASGLPDADIIHTDECHPQQDENTPTCNNASGPDEQEDDTPTCNNASYLDSKDAILQASPSGDDPSPEKPEHQKEHDPSIPPTVDVAGLLLAIAGTAQSHIKMCKSGPKYITIPEALTRDDVIAHLKGFLTLGGRLSVKVSANSPASTRSLCDDGDNEADLERLKAAALLLAQAGFKPVLEVSPAEGKHTGGGHLWVFFDRLVDAYSARQTVIEIAPMLAESKEYWPHEEGEASCPPNVRLPGGKYIYDGVNAWCKLYDAYGNELAHDGDGAAATLLAMQTPAALVRKYEKKTELVLVQQPVRSTPKPEQGGYLDKDDVKAVISEFNASHSWDEIANMAGGYNKARCFPASWRDDNNPNVKVNPKTDLAKDFSTSAWFAGSMDKYDCWCLIQGKANWEAFKKQDLDQRCREYRQKYVAA